MANGDHDDTRRSQDAEDAESQPVELASSPCALHEVDPAYAGLEPEDDAAARDVARWRKAERERLIAARLALSQAERARISEAIARRLEGVLGDVAGRTISVYWPFRGEPDLRALMTALVARGAVCALPIVLARGQPLTFRAWTPDAPMTRGVWNIPIPAEGPEITPGALIAPVVGFDPRGYRLGYGGGFFDRTLARLGGDASAIGVGWSGAEMATIRPQTHDIPMSAIVTEAEVRTPY